MTRIKVPTNASLSVFEMETSMLLQASMAFVFVSLLSMRICASKSTMIRNDSITANETVVSAGGQFALGFFSPENSSNRYVGIWYNRIPDHMVIWVANRESPLTDSSGVVTFDGSGNLVILDGSGNAFWSTNISTTTNNSRAELLDSGNLVLTEIDSSGGAGRVVWESFDHPTNAFLPMMKLGVNLKTKERRLVTSWKSVSDPSLGSFSLGIDFQKLPQLFVWNGSVPHFRGGPFNGQIFLGIPQMIGRSYVNGYNIIRDEEQGTISVIYAFSNVSFVGTYILNSSGKIQYVVWNEEKAEWNLLWSAPENRCENYGTCGPFGSCSVFRKPICSCLRGFKPKSIEEWNAGNWSSGCVRRTQLNCDIGASSSIGNGSIEQGHGNGFFKLERMKPPDNTEWRPGDDINTCKDECLNNCSCVAYAYDSRTECMLWSGNLIDVHEFKYGGVDLYIRVAHSELDEKKDIKGLTIVIVIIGTLSLGVCAYFLWRWMTNGDKKKDQEMPLFDMDVIGQGSSSINIKQAKLPKMPLVDFKTVAVATNNFFAGNKLGEGGFGPVYKGKLPNGQEIAVKRLSKSSGQGLEEFKNEVILISKLQHRNLVRLLGFCIEGEEKMLLYEFMPNKSLDAFLFDPTRQTPLHWDKRFQVIEGIARGILYLHRDSGLRIIHRDLKASNILLDGELHPKISDFGMARILGGDEMLARTKRVVGTYGYMSPEYAMEGRFSEKSDVFSFGVLLLEIVSGKKNSRFHDHERSFNLLSYAWQLWNERKLFELVDPALGHSSSQSEALRCIHVGLLCVQEFARDRPSMSSVVFMLSNDAATLPTPKQPAFTQRSLTESESSHGGHEICSINNVSVTFTLSQGR